VHDAFPVVVVAVVLVVVVVVVVFYAGVPKGSPGEIN
jgi:hypothetical protein